MFQIVKGLSLTLSQANDPEFVDRGLKYIDEVTLVSEAAKNFPSVLVPYVEVLSTSQCQD
jgi:hypothetical protein